MSRGPYDPGGVRFCGGVEDSAISWPEFRGLGHGDLPPDFSTGSCLETASATCLGVSVSQRAEFSPFINCFSAPSITWLLALSSEIIFSTLVTTS